MIALRLLNTESQDKADYLHNQLITDINVPSTYWECAESYLKGVGIYDVFLISSKKSIKSCWMKLSSAIQCKNA